MGNRKFSSWQKFLLEMDDIKSEQKIGKQIAAKLKDDSPKSHTFTVTGKDGKKVEAIVDCVATYSGNIDSPIKVTCGKPKPEGSPGFEKAFAEMQKNMKKVQAEFARIKSAGGSSSSGSGRSSSGSTRKPPCGPDMKRRRVNGRCVKK
jgi:hypothetical protein